jgi:hypothetical protein
MPLFSTTAEFQQYINVVGTLNIESLKPYEQDSREKYLRPYLGTTLLKEIVDFQTDNTVPVWADMDEDEVSDAITNLLPYVLSPLAAFMVYEAAPALDVKVTESGFAVISNTSLSPASAERVKNFRAQMEQTGFGRIETLLRFLEQYQYNYPGWAASEAYSQSTRNFINTTELFDSIVNIEQSRLRFMRMRPTMDNVEILQVEPVISKDLADMIRDQVRTSELTEENEALLIPLRRAVAYLTAGIDMDPKYTQTGIAFLSEVKKILDAAPEDYPEYMASDCYDSTKTSYAAYENSEDSTVFQFGG